jgi:hypothetical protein
MKVLFFIFLFFPAFHAQVIPLPPRNSEAPSGSEFINVIWNMPRDLREEAIYSQIISGNIPDFMRQLIPIQSTANIGGINHSAVYFVIPEYLAVGSDSDYFLTPMSPILAQRISNAINCILPTKKMVDQIYTIAPCKLRPQPIPPSSDMITVPVFSQHNDSVKSLRLPVLPQYPFGTLVGGTKKDVIISNYIYQNLKPNGPKPVVIYGWHQLNGQPIQPVYNGHEESYADYSHGVRLVLDSIVVNGEPKTITQLLADPVLCQLISDEGTILKPYYTLEGNPAPTPKSFGVIWNNPTSLIVVVPPVAIGTLWYKAFWGYDGLSFTDSTIDFADNLILTGLQTDSIFFFKLRAQSPQGYSLFSEILAAITSTSKPQVLVVNGFDRGSSGNTYNFVRQHGNAFRQNGYSFCSVTNEAVLDGLVSLNDYSIVDYILGDESTANETFSSAEQESLKVFLKSGGKLFVSGSEVAWDLDYKGTASDKDFNHNYLKCQYVSDAPNNQAGVFYQAESILNSIFDGVDIINFDNGSQGTINVRYPDVLTGINGGLNCLQYSNVTNQFAGTSFEGIFPNAAVPGKVILVGFPFESIYPEEKRNIFLSNVISFFNMPVGISEDVTSNLGTFQLYQNYPNPFNPTTRISWQSPSSGWQVLKVFDVLGNEIATLVDEERETGYYSVEFDASNLSSGIYLYRLKTENYIAEKKMIILK